LQPHELVRFWFMLRVACELLFFALLPFLFHYTDQGPDRIWALPSGALAVALVALTVIGYLQARDPVLSRSRWTYTYIIGSGAFSALALANCFAMLNSAKPGYYLACLGWLLFFSTSLFVRLVRASVGIRAAPDRSSDRGFLSMLASSTSSTGSCHARAPGGGRRRRTRPALV
jgi:predicted acyltransferase